MMFRLLLLLGFLLPPTLAGAVEPLRVSGFGTLGVVTSDAGEFSLLRFGINEPGKDNPNYGVDSILGLQAIQSLTQRIDLTVQVIAREDQSGSAAPRVAWAFMRFAPTGDLEARIGRLRTPFFMYSDSLWINYANPWMRPPEEVYGLNPFSDLDGADLTWKFRTEGIDFELRPFIGHSKLKLQDASATLKQVRGLNFSMHHEAFSLFLGHAESPFSLPWNDPLFNATAQALAGSPFAPLVRQIGGEDGYARFDSIGMQWDGNDFLVSAEYARRRANRYIPSAHAMQLTLGRRWGLVSTYATLARQVQDAPVASADLSAAPPLAALFDTFLESRNTARHSLTLGARWDLHRNAALRFEVSRIHVASESWGGLYPIDLSKSGSPAGRRIHVFGLSLDTSF